MPRGLRQVGEEPGKAPLALVDAALFEGRQEEQQGAVRGLALAPVQLIQGRGDAEAEVGCRLCGAEGAVPDQELAHAVDPGV
eukprot:9937341-Lingulodinium_polyedra.AAC.1